MSEAIESLEDLLRALGRERDLRGRMRVLARAWRLLRSLPPAQREQVALRVGSRWAWRRIEKAFLRDGELDEGERRIGTAFQRMGEADPREIRKLARELREGDGQAAKDLLVLTLSEALEQEAGEQEAAQQEPADRAPSSAPEPPPRSGTAPPATPEPEVVETARAVLASARAQPIAAAPATPPPAPEPEPESAPPPTLPEIDDAAPVVAVRGGAERLRVLRRLQRSPRPAAELDPAGRRQLLASLGGGWASRRALSRMIETRSLGDVDEALAHIRQLLRPGQQFWCLADLIEHWRLEGVEIERILTAAPTDAARRRLARRVASSTR